MADGEVALEAGVLAREVALDRDRLDPVNDVLQPQVGPHRLRDVHGRPRVARLGAHVQEHRPVRPKHPRGRRDPRRGPFEVVGLRQRVLIAVVPDPQVVGRRRHDHVDRVRLEVTENVNAI